MRIINDHVVNPVNDQLLVQTTDQPGSGNANHSYTISRYDAANNPSRLDGQANTLTHVLFQNGPINEVGVNGVTHEALLAIVADRLRSFQSGPYACRENAIALTKIEEAMHWMQQRTIARMRRGVEGTHTV